VLSFPLEVLFVLLRGLSGLLFYSTAVAIVVTLLLTLLMMIWVLIPGFLGGYEALVDRLPTWAQPA